jgi:protein-tyrosine-phosphatase
MAEYLLRHRLGPRSDWKVASAGLHAVDGMPASPEARQVLAECKIDLGPHRSHPLDAELAGAATLIAVMTRAHLDRIEAQFPDAAEKAFLLKGFDDAAGATDIRDPIGLSRGVYRDIRDEIDAALPGLIAFLHDLDVA